MCLNKTERAPVTALSGGNTSEESFAISTVNLAAPYAVFQAVSLDGPGSLGGLSVGSQDGEVIERATAPEETASALTPVSRVLVRLFMYSTIGSVGVDGGLFVAFADEGFFRRGCMVDAKTATCVGHVRSCGLPFGAWVPDRVGWFMASRSRCLDHQPRESLHSGSKKNAWVCANLTQHNSNAPPGHPQEQPTLTSIGIVARSRPEKSP